MLMASQTSYLYAEVILWSYPRFICQGSQSFHQSSRLRRSDESRTRCYTRCAIALDHQHISDSLNEALGNTALNVVGNQEYAQAVHHVSFCSICYFTLSDGRPVIII